LHSKVRPEITEQNKKLSRKLDLCHFLEDFIGPSIIEWHSKTSVFYREKQTSKQDYSFIVTDSQKSKRVFTHSATGH